jgi:DNA-binding winged helix-turn-helix (wHTH) protein/tetratricopeptide (TPR) repeat protein
VLRFAGFALDRDRAELRGPDGEAVRIRPKTFDMLSLLAANAGRVLSKQQLMDAVWPNVHVSEDSLFQCIRELRTALGDSERRLIKVVSGRGYVFEAEVLAEPAGGAPAEAARVEPVADAADVSRPARSRWPFVLDKRAAFAAVAGLLAVAGIAAATLILWPDTIRPGKPAVAVTRIASLDANDDPTAASVAALLADGLARIESIRVLRDSDTAPWAAGEAEFALSGELQKTGPSWELRARLIRTATKEVVWAAPVTVAIADTDPGLQHQRLAAGTGHLLARRINELTRTDARATTADGHAKVVVEQARALINQTNKERFAAAQTMLEKALADDPDNVDLGVALAALQLRGVQMLWYGPEQSIAAEKNAKATLERALRARPDSIPVLEAYCRFLNATNYFVESLVACARTLSFDPWNGLVLYHIGLSQVQLGRFDEALATFKQADRFDTPQVSRWTWLLGAGMTLMLMDRSEEALPWLQRSLAITPGSGRTHMLLSAVYQQLGRTDEARAAMEKGLELRPGSNLVNVTLPPKNASPIFVAAAEWIVRAYLAAGLPER